MLLQCECLVASSHNFLFLTHKRRSRAMRSTFRSPPKKKSLRFIDKDRADQAAGWGASTICLAPDDFQEDNIHFGPSSFHSRRRLASNVRSHSTRKLITKPEILEEDLMETSQFDKDDEKNGVGQSKNRLQKKTSSSRYLYCEECSMSGRRTELQKTRDVKRQTSLRVHTSDVPLRHPRRSVSERFHSPHSRGKLISKPEILEEGTNIVQKEDGKNGGHSKHRLRKKASSSHSLYCVACSVCGRRTELQKPRGLKRQTSLPIPKPDIPRHHPRRSVSEIFRRPRSRTEEGHKRRTKKPPTRKNTTPYHRV